MVAQVNRSILQNSFSMWFCSVAFLLSAYFSEDGRQFPSLTMVGSFPAIMVTMYPFFPKLIATTFPFFVWKI